MVELGSVRDRTAWLPNSAASSGSVSGEMRPALPKAGGSDMSVTLCSLTPEDRSDIVTLWNFHVMDSGTVAADTLLVLGSHDLRVADRAAELYLDERAA